MYSDPLAYLLTWSCYGTWLHGDERGSVDDEHCVYGTPVVQPNERRRVFEAGLLKRPPLILSGAMRALVDRSIREHCGFRRWRLHAVNVRTTHVHAVVGATRQGPSVMAGQLKAWSTRRLREMRLIARDAPVWTKGPSTRYLWKDEDLAQAIDYVLNRQ